jgi:ABC-type histidine transport system ATPase subunit
MVAMAAIDLHDPRVGRRWSREAVVRRGPACAFAPGGVDLVGELRGRGVTMVIATHEMSFARQVADRVAFLDNGRVLEQGPPAQVLGEPVEPRTRQFLARIIEAGRL